MSDAHSDQVTFKAFFEKISKDQPESPYEKFMLLSNPFPAAGQFIADICVDQEEVKFEFLRKLQDFYTDGRSTRVRITGETGAGKTNILRFFEKQIREAPVNDLFSVFIQEPQGSYLQVHRQLVSQIGALFYTRFFEVMRSGSVKFTDLKTELAGLNPELVRVLEQTALGNRAQASLFGPDLTFLRTLDNWLQGIKLSSSEKKQLGGVSVEIGSSSTLAVKFTSDLLRIFRYAQLFKGLTILFDEFEEIFSGLTAVQQSQYAQDLRNLFDSLPDGIIFVIATAPLSTRLDQLSPALTRRLGTNVTLQPIVDEESALDYAREYIRLGRKRYEERAKKERKLKATLPKNIPTQDKDFYPLTRTSIIDYYQKLREQAATTPGDFLPVLNLALYRLVYEEREA